MFHVKAVLAAVVAAAVTGLITALAGRNSTAALVVAAVVAVAVIAGVESLGKAGWRGRIPWYRGSDSQGDWEILNKDREGVYAQNYGLFLTHTWRPSLDPGQVADVYVRLTQHRDGPLAQRRVKSVEYTWGPNFSEHSQVVTRPEKQFEMEVSLYAPLLLLARVTFTDGRSPLLLTRYINIDVPPATHTGNAAEANSRPRHQETGFQDEPVHIYIPQGDEPKT